MGWGDYWPAAWMFLGPGFIIMLAICIVMMMLMMRRGSGALDILNGRHARGELDEAGLEERRRVPSARTS